jgi:hypothetical protein
MIIASVFAMLARHFMPHQVVLAWLTRDPDFQQADAVNMLRQEGTTIHPNAIDSWGGTGSRTF